jgi:uncharacterized membrane protein
MSSAQTGNSFANNIKHTLVTGFFAILPLALMVAVLIWVMNFLQGLVGPQSACGRMFRSIGMTVTACEWMGYVFGAVGAVLLVYFLGLLIEHRIGKQWNKTIDNALQQIPLVGTVYDASKNLTSVFDRRDDALQRMMPVMCCFGGDSSVAIPCLMPTPELIQFGGVEYHIVVIPTAPVPFGGALVCVRREWVKPAECSLDELIGIYMSMGSSAPGCFDRVKAAEAAPPQA